MLDYTITEVKDSYGSTDVSVTFSGGTFKVDFTSESHAAVNIGQSYGLEPCEFKVRGVAVSVTGYISFWADSEWDDVNPDSDVNKHHAARNSSYRDHDATLYGLTPKRADAVKEMVREIVRDIVAQHPDILAHAQTRRAQLAYVKAHKEVQPAKDALNEALRVAGIAHGAYDSAHAAESQLSATVEIAPYYDHEKNYVMP